MTVFLALVIATLLVAFWRAVLAMVAVCVVALLILGISTVVQGSGSTHGFRPGPATSSSRGASSPSV